MFDRVVVINLDERADRLAAFTARAAGLRALAGWRRQRAIRGDAVGVPGFFKSGGGAWGCRASHLRALEDALMDGVETLLVLEDDCRFAADFDARLEEFLAAVPDDWGGLMLGGQDHKPPVPVAPGVVRAVDAQRTHAYAVRGAAAMKALYKLWSRADRHIDHLLGHWQAQVSVYQPDPFLCGQDAGTSDINGRREGVRFWSPAPPGAPVYLLDVGRDVADELARLGATWGDRCPRTGVGKKLGKLAAAGWPAAELAKWAAALVAECVGGDRVPCFWHPGADLGAVAARMGRPTVRVTGSTEEAAAVLGLLADWRASRVTWLLRGEPPAGPEWATGRPPVRARLHRLVAAGDYGKLPDVVRQLGAGRRLVAHPALDCDRAMAALGGAAAELVGGPAEWADQLAFAGRN